MKESKYLPLYIGGLSAIAFVLAAPGATAEDAEHDTCQVVGNHPPEPIGDRQGHALETEVDSCRVVEGPMAGGVLTVTNIWEWDGAKAKLLSGGGIVRKPGATAAFQSVDGNLELIMSEGKITGVTGTGHTLINLATGGAASLQGKTVTWTAKTTGQDTFEVTGNFQ